MVALNTFVQLPMIPLLHCKIVIGNQLLDN